MTDWRLRPAALMESAHELCNNAIEAAVTGSVLDLYYVRT
jgi:hypothetical protein